MNYRKEKLFVKAPGSRSSDDRVLLEDCCVLGKTVESSLSLAYRPKVGALPIPLACQSANDLRCVDITNVKKEGGHKARTESIAIPKKIAEKALLINADIQKLLRSMGAEVLTVDHSGGSKVPTAHDILVTPSIGSASSSLEKGLHSFEVRVREIESKKAFDWEGTLTNEALPLFRAELQTKEGARLLKSRILVLVQVPRPCLSGNHEIHTTICKSIQLASLDTCSQPKWARFSSWAGFRKIGDSGSANGGARFDAKPAGLAMPAVRRSAIPPRPSLSPAQKWAMLLGRLPAPEEGRWIKLALFLHQVQEPAGHTMRYLSPDEKKCWTFARGRVPKVRKDFVKRKGGRGGGAGDGIPYCSKDFLEEVFLRHYASRWSP